MFKRFKALSGGKKVGVIVASVFALGFLGNLTSPPQNSVSNQNKNVSNQQKIQIQQAPAKVKAIETKEVTEDQTIPFGATTQNDPTMVSGRTALAVAGVNGSKTITYKVTTENGIETSREKTSEVVIATPVTQVTKVGTYVAPAQPTCPNGTYVNTYGNSVCRPFQSPSTPPGATARCVDGSYSYSQSRRGTCSHHGGVSTWL